MSASSVAVMMSLDQNIQQSEERLAEIANLIQHAEDPLSAALFEGSTRELTALYVDEFGSETYLQENAGELDSRPQVTQIVSLPSSESITLALSTEVAYAGAMGTLAPLSLVTLLVILLATLVTHLILKRDVWAIQNLIQQARTIAMGGERRLAQLRGSLEVETLASSLATMVTALDQSEKTLEKFLSDASHELKTPLTVVRGYLDMLSRPTVASEVRDSAQKALKQAIRMQHIIDDLLEIAEVRSADSKNDETVNLSNLVLDALDDLKAMGADHIVEASIEADVFVTGSSQQLQSMLANLIGNLNAHLAPRTPVQIRLTGNDHFVELSLADAGPGFPSEILANSDEPVRFRRGDNTKPGSTGLGLALIFEVVAKHRGTLKLATSQLGGAQTKISFPR